MLYNKFSYLSKIMHKFSSWSRVIAIYCSIFLISYSFHRNQQTLQTHNVYIKWMFKYMLLARVPSKSDWKHAKHKNLFPKLSLALCFYFALITRFLLCCSTSWNDQNKNWLSGSVFGIQRISAGSGWMFSLSLKVSSM